MNLPEKPRDVGDCYLLKACPFCGGEPLLAKVTCPNGLEQYFFRCRSCACEGPWGKSEGTAVLMWNMRTKHEKWPLRNRKAGS
jgi:Lar family restriction alleviation protein